MLSFQQLPIINPALVVHLDAVYPVILLKLVGIIPHLPLIIVIIHVYYNIIFMLCCKFFLTFFFRVEEEYLTVIEALKLHNKRYCKNHTN